MGSPFGRDAAAAGLLVAANLLAVAIGHLALPPLDRAPALVLAGFGALAAVEVAPLALRRHAPVAVVAATSVAFAVRALVPPPAYSVGAGGLALIIAAYSAGAYASRRRAALTLSGVALAALAVSALAAVLGRDLFGQPAPQDVPRGVLLVAPALMAVLYVVVPGLVGAYVQTRRAYAAELVDRAERFKQERDERARRAVVEERGRIARDLHDVAAHHLSSIVVQAGAAEQLAEQDPKAAREALAFIRRQGKETLSSMRQLVGLLRPFQGDAASCAPQPTLDRAQALAVEARAAGLHVDLEIQGEPRPLPTTVDLAAYRVLQEALTNARRHAPDAPATALVAYRPDAVVVVVRNEPSPRRWRTPGDEGGGHGLVGMRERVALAGGDLEAGPLPDGGWQVRARLPTIPEEGQ